MKQVLSVALSLLALAGAVWGLRVWLESTGRLDFRVLLTTPDPVVDGPVRLRQVGRRVGDAVVRVDGSVVDVPGGSEDGELTLTPDSLGPGLHTVSWEMPYLGRAPRRATFGLLSGPFLEPVAASRCGVRLAVSQRLLDTLADDLAPTLRESVARARGLPRIAEVEVALELVKEGLDARALVAFDGGSELRAVLPLRILSDGAGIVSVEQREDVRVEVTGALGTLAAIKGGGILAALVEVVNNPAAGIDGALDAARQAGRDEVQRYVEAELDTWLARLNERIAEALPTTLSGEAFGAKVTLTLAPCGKPVIRPGRSLVLRYDAPSTVEGPGAPRPPTTASAIPGPVATAAAELPADAGPDEGASLTLSEPVLNALLDGAWRSGALAATAASPDVVRRVNARLAGAASFRVEGIDLPLPPVVRLAPDGARVTLAEARVRLLEDGDRPLTLAFTGGAEVGIERRAGKLSLSARPAAVHGSCTESHPEGLVRRPCFQDLLDTLDDALATRGEVAALVPAMVKTPRGSLEVTRVVMHEGALEVVAELRLAAP